MMNLSRDFLLNLAASLTYDLLRAGTARLKALVLGEPAQRDLQACYQAAFQAMLEEVAAGLTLDEANLLEDILHQFVQQPAVADVLLDMALGGAPAPDLPALRHAFDAMEFDRATLPVDFDRALAAFHQGLAAALWDKASQQDSPLFNRVNLGRVIAIQALLQQQQHTLDEIVQGLQRLDAQGGLVYNIIIQEATGLAISDGARVEQSALPQEVSDVLKEIIAVVRRFAPKREAMADSVQGITRLPTDYSTRIQNFILEYTGTSQNPVPFGGREEALRALNDWFAAGDSPPYLLLAAPTAAAHASWLSGGRALGEYPPASHPAPVERAQRAQSKPAGGTTPPSLPGFQASAQCFRAGHRLALTSPRGTVPIRATPLCPSPLPPRGRGEGYGLHTAHEPCTMGVW